ncbi:cell division cycle-associated protein 2 [Hemicordylus capensis]|uniref:cell division cycle-associated protein 2 n=1 Tax=Hemicordylus capensis TaxID=884348 RepID=UPI0023047DDC|nr:cell division cycle-associated protein 2 [Hemicordylus capensis]XP_053125039.1 cell division cycle-associated protein 2 [Hemicordylus capensis]XP_053125040.1 cell division cycle-associated protein 2 [Hemicordylus capensis]XP_053125041.1 cell division cycle-associated protein 2 [Hemicordylus capensis]
METKSPNPETASHQTSPPRDFSALLAADFGITSESFAYQLKGQSKSVTHKLRRRSTIGARGSPENDALICYIARQRNTANPSPSWQNSPYSIFEQASPFKQGYPFLKDKIAAFQSSFKPLEEIEERVIHSPFIFQNPKTRPHEPSKSCRGWPCERQAFSKATQTLVSADAEITSPDIPVCNILNFSEQPLIPCTATVSKAVPALQPNIRKSQCLSLETSIPRTGILKRAHEIQSHCAEEELNSNAASQQSFKKVRFATQRSLEIFDESKPPVTPLQKGHFPPSVLSPDAACLRSVLKKTPVQILPRGIKEEPLDYTNAMEGRETLPYFKSGPLKTGPLKTERRTRSTCKTKEHSKDVDFKVLDPPMDISLLKGALSFSPPESRNERHFAVTPTKHPFMVSIKFDNDNILQGTLEVVPATEHAVNSEPEETNTRSPDRPATCSRTMRSSSKRKCAVQAEAANLSLRAETRSKREPPIKVLKPSKDPKVNSHRRSASKKTLASKHKVFGKRKKKKKEQKSHEVRETVSKKPLLSPIPEAKEDTSFASSYLSTPKLQISILDSSPSSDLPAEPMNETAEKTNSVVHRAEEESSCLDSSLALVKEETLPCFQSSSSSQLQDTARHEMQTMSPWDLPEKWDTNENEQVLKSVDSSSETELQLPNLFTTGKKNSKRASRLVRGPATELMNQGDAGVNVKIRRRSRGIGHNLPNAADVQSETAVKNSGVPRRSLEEWSPSEGASEFLNYLQDCIEESFRSVPINNNKKVRRSMRHLKDAETEGLGWIQVPVDDSASQAPCGSASKVQEPKCTSSSRDSESCCPRKQERRVCWCLPMREKQADVPVVKGPCRSRRRRSICAWSLEENTNFASPVQRKQRASLGYKNDQCCHKYTKVREFLGDHPST